MELLHECQSARNEGSLVPLPLSPFKTPRRLSIPEMGRHSDPLKVVPVPYYENYYCKHCGAHVLRSMPPKEAS